MEPSLPDRLSELAILGAAGLVEVIAIIGYYTLIGNTLNVFQVPVPDEVTPPFAE
jgi:4-carboxymuconolactone decarboxylase